MKKFYISLKALQDHGISDFWKYIATDEDGKIFLYHRKPHRLASGIWHTALTARKRVINNSYCKDWKNSVRKITNELSHTLDYPCHMDNKQRKAFKAKWKYMATNTHDHVYLFKSKPQIQGENWFVLPFEIMHLNHVPPYCDSWMCSVRKVKFKKPTTKERNKFLLETVKYQNAQIQSNHEGISRLITDVKLKDAKLSSLHNRCRNLKNALTRRNAENNELKAAYKIGDEELIRIEEKYAKIKLFVNKGFSQVQELIMDANKIANLANKITLNHTELKITNGEIKK